MTCAGTTKLLAEAAARIWPTLRLAAGAAASGLGAMLGSGFPGLVQLGIGGVGLLHRRGDDPLGAALAGPGGTDQRPLPAPLRRRWGVLGAAAGWPGPVVLAATAGLAAAGGPAWRRDLAALSPVPRAAQELNAELRRQLGAPDVPVLFALGPGTEEAALGLRTPGRDPSR